MFFTRKDVENQLQIQAFVDSGWAGSAYDRRSASGYCFSLGGNMVIRKSKKQNVVARSSAESRYRAVAKASTELVWLKMLLEELGFTVDKPMVLWCDYQAAFHIAKNPLFHERTKNIKVDCHCI